MTLAGVEGAIGGDRGDLLVGRDLIEQFGQHRRVPNVAGGELGRPDFQGFLIDPDVDLAPDPAFGAAMLAGIPFALTSTLMPVLSTSRCKGPSEPRQGMLTFKVF